MFNRTPRTNLLVATVWAGSLLLSSCSSSTMLRSEELADTEESRAIIVMNVKKGDTVKLVTTEGKTLKFEVVAIDSAAITSKDRRIPFGEISKLEKVKVDDATMFLGVVNAIGAIAAVGGIIAMIVLINLLKDVLP